MSKDTLKETVAEIATVQNRGFLQSTKDSIQGWREIAGTTAGFAIFIDLMFVLLGYIGWIQAGPLHWVGAIAIAIGVLGLLEKTGRRVL